MKYICNFLLLMNYLVYIVLDILMWKDGANKGLIFLLPLVLFPIIVSLANKVAVSQADKFFLSEWDVFVKKIKWGNGTIFCIMIIVYQLFLSQGN